MRPSIFADLSGLTSAILETIGDSNKDYDASKLFKRTHVVLEPQSPGQ